MFRSRLWRSLLLLFGMFVVLYLTVSLYLPSSRRLIVMEKLLSSEPA